MRGLKVGDKVTYTNPGGIVFSGHVITGLCDWDWDTFKGRVFINSDSPWFPVERERLKLEDAGEEMKRKMLEIMPDNEKAPSMRQHQTEPREILPRVIISQKTESNPIWLCGFIGSVRNFKSMLKATNRYLETGTFAP